LKNFSSRMAAALRQRLNSSQKIHFRSRLTLLSLGCFPSELVRRFTSANLGTHSLDGHATRAQDRADV
jgi:hypothetical protein